MLYRKLGWLIAQRQIAHACCWCVAHHHGAAHRLQAVVVASTIASTSTRPTCTAAGPAAVGVGPAGCGCQRVRQVAPVGQVLAHRMTPHLHGEGTMSAQQLLRWHTEGRSAGRHQSRAVPNGPCLEAHQSLHVHACIPGGCAQARGAAATGAQADGTMPVARKSAPGPSATPRCRAHAGRTCGAGSRQGLRA